MIRWIHTKHQSIYDQLRLEEQLLRGSTDNFVIINEGSPPAIVMGLSGKAREMVNLELHQKNPIPIIRRYSGGGTVVVDENTLFVSFIFNHIFDFPLYPAHLLKWTETLYRDIFPQEHFALIENDYVWGNHKIGGNAQYLQKNRWVHHTTFLWDYNPSLMDLLHIPSKRPQYRQDRPHSEFITTLKDKWEKKVFIQALKDRIAKFGKIDENYSVPESLPAVRMATRVHHV